MATGADLKQGREEEEEEEEREHSQILRCMLGWSDMLLEAPETQEGLLIFKCEIVFVKSGNQIPKKKKCSTKRGICF